MKPISRLLRCLIASAMFLTLAAPRLFAQEAGYPGEQSPESFFKWLHFVIIAAVLIWLVKWVLPPVIRRNADEITAAISKATAARAAAEKQLKEAAAKLTTLEQEVARFREQAQREAAAEVNRLRAMTKTDMEKVGVAAKAEIEAAERAAREELRVLAARLAVDRAQSLVAGEMTPAVQEAMINSFVQCLEGRPN
jgi:F0F1-type ATP synthase membrane subunit b/b'